MWLVGRRDGWSTSKGTACGIAEGLAFGAGLMTRTQAKGNTVSDRRAGDTPVTVECGRMCALGLAHVRCRQKAYFPRNNSSILR